MLDCSIEVDPQAYTASLLHFVILVNIVFGFYAVGTVADTGVIIFFGYLVDCYVILVVLSLGYGGVMKRGEAAVGWRRQQQLDARSSLQCCSVIAARWLDCLGCAQTAEIIFSF